jgi:hypothetical protein
MKYTNDDRNNIGNLYSEMFSKKLKNNEKILKEENFYDVEDEAERLDGDLDAPIGGGEDLDNDMMGDALEEKVYARMNEEFSDTFRRQCDDIKDKFDLSDDEFCMFFKGWFDENHVQSHLEGEL